MNRKDYILFDLDGTLTDPKEGITKSVQYALKHFGIQEDDLDSLTPFYNRLVGILAELGNPFSTRAFCHQMFDVEKRTVASVSDEEVSQWKERHRKV